MKLKHILLALPVLIWVGCEDKQEKDCAGVEGGTAIVDNCGTCDSDATNDCIEDCAGEFGGTAMVDSCGTCDSDATNDCVQDCSGEWGGENICGCMDMTAMNYDSTATFDNGSCEFLSFTYLAGVWTTTNACISSDPDGCDTCEDQPLYKCRCGDNDENCDYETVEALSDEESCTAEGGIWTYNWWSMALYDDGTAGEPPHCGCGEDEEETCDGTAMEALENETDCIAGGGVWDSDPPHDATYSIDGLNVELAWPWGDTVTIPFSNNQLPLTVSESPNCECQHDECNENAAETATDASSCDTADGEWEEGYCIVLILER
ncbi:MAG: hypothetical protein QF453_04725 [Candidatus Marinimicrobia bacterium]|jgi:hypothetical protein|nr:hypothetical protein [Candidatus Neomarinimicrobiota bacterium]